MRARKDSARCAHTITKPRLLPAPCCSRLFLYYNSRLLGGKRAANGLMPDTGSSLRACCKAVSHFGVAPEQLWPYQERMVAVQPPQGDCSAISSWCTPHCSACVAALLCTRALLQPISCENKFATSHPIRRKCRSIRGGQAL